jgi:hypothetical protein
MEVYDVDRVLQPTANLVHASSVPPEEKRLTFQHFNTNNVVIIGVAPHNCDAHLPDDVDWPLDLVFDAAYGIAALKKWGTPKFQEFIQNSTSALYHEHKDNGGDKNNRGNDMDEGNGGQKQPALGQSERSQRAAKRTKTRNDGQTGNAKQPHDFHDMLLGIWMLTAKEDLRKARAEKAERTEEAVRTWLDSV